MTELFDGATASRFAWTLIHFLWQGMLVAAVCLGAERSLRLRSARSRYGLMLSFLALMAACPVVTWFRFDDVARTRGSTCK